MIRVIEIETVPERLYYHIYFLSPVVHVRHIIRYYLQENSFVSFFIRVVWTKYQIREFLTT